MELTDARFRLLVESVQDYAIYAVDECGMVCSWNAGAERIEGWRASEVLGKHFSLFYTPEDNKAERCKEQLEVALANGRLEDAGWRVRKDGSRFWRPA
jgi:PAS domain S-box-containing protein